MIKAYLHGCHRNFTGESLLFRTLEILAEIKVVDKLSKANLVIAGPQGLYRNKMPFALHYVPKIRNYITPYREPIKTYSDHISLFYSSEPPPAGFFQTSNCIYGISSEILVESPTHYRLPYWMEGLDWADYGIRKPTTDRAGLMMKPAALAEERDPSFVLRKKLQLAIIASHMNGFRQNLMSQLIKVVEVKGFGAYFDKTILHHNESGFTKKEVLSSFAFNFCPENTIYPGYVTEKILEAYVCGTIPVSFVDPTACSYDFNRSSLINLYEHCEDIPGYFSAMLNDKQRLASIASQPLFEKIPSLDSFISFISGILSLV